jgi:hypothetical protein
MCLGLLMSYKVPSDPLIVIKKAQQIRNAYLYAMPYVAHNKPSVIHKE